MGAITILFLVFSDFRLKGLNKSELSIIHCLKIIVIYYFSLLMVILTLLSKRLLINTKAIEAMPKVIASHGICSIPLLRITQPPVIVPAVTPKFANDAVSPLANSSASGAAELIDDMAIKTPGAYRIPQAATRIIVVIEELPVKYSPNGTKILHPTKNATVVMGMLLLSVFPAIHVPSNPQMPKTNIK